MIGCRALPPSSGLSLSLPYAGSSIGAVLFDLEGALVDTGIWRFQALDRVLRLHGFVVPASDLLTRLAGQPLRHKLARLSAARGLPRSLHAEIEVLEQRITQRIAERQCHPDIDRMGVLRSLSRRGLRLGAIAHAGRDLAETLARRSGIRAFLDVLVCEDDLPDARSGTGFGADRRDDATLPGIALRALAAAPEQTLAVAATACVIQNARQLGVHVLATDGRLELAAIEASLAALQLDPA